MWRKLLIAGIALVGSFSVAYAFQYNNEMKAAVSQTIVTTTASMGDSFSTRNGTTYSTSKHKMYMANFNDKIIEWEFIKRDISGKGTYLLMPTNAIAGLLWFSNNVQYTTSQYQSAISGINKGLVQSEKDLIKKGAFYSNEYVSLATETTFKDGGTYALNDYYRAEMTQKVVTNGATDATSFIMLSTAYDLTDNVYCIYAHDFTYPGEGTFKRGGLGPCLVNGNNAMWGFRPNAVTNANSIVFAVAPNAGITTKTLVKANKNGTETMKARVFNTTLKTTFNSIGVNKTGIFQTINKITKGKNFIIKHSNTSVASDNKISLLVKDCNSGLLKYYLPLQTATTATGEIIVDTTNWDLGQYTLNLVVEKDTSDNRPVACSALSTGMNLEIVNPLTITYTNSVGIPSYGASSIQAGASVGYITPSNGVSPYSYEILPDSTNSDGYEYFTLSSNTNANGSRNVLINSTKAPNGLPAGTYKFTISAVDANGHPVDSNGNPTAKADVTLTVNKATPTISFVDPNKRIEPYVSGKSFTENVTHTNTDSGVIPTYQTNNNIVTANADASGNAEITLNTTNTTGDVTVTATLPASDNFNAATATKQINVYAGITDFKFTPSKTPILTTDTLNANYLIGQLSLQNGVANYNYSIDTDPNGNASDNANSTSFKVDTSQTSAKTMKVYTTGQLTAGTYKVTFKAKDQNNQELYLPVTITVSPADQTGFEFYDYETNAKITNGTKEIEYGTSNAKVVASGGLGTGTVSYKIKDGQPNDVIDLDTSNGTITAIHKTGSVVVEATKASDSNYNATTIEMTVKIIDGTQTITFSPPTSKKFVLDDSIPISASLTRTDGSTGTITYVSNDTSVCTIDDSDASNVKAVMKAEGDCSITASNGDTYYKAVSDTKKINLYGGITGTFIQVIDPLNQGDAKAQAGSSDTIAKVTSLAGGDGTFNLVKMTVKKAGVNVTNMFDLDHSWNITPKQSLTYGDYDFSIEIEDGNQEASTITGTLTIGLETNNSFEITKDSTVITELTTDYVTAQNPKIMLNTQGKKGTGSVHFILVDSTKDPNEADEAITINDIGTITVNRAMTSNDLYYVQAYIDEDKSNGYAKQETKKVRVIVNESPQSITFDSTVPTSIKYDVDQTFDISATLDRTPGDITYSSTTPSICVVEDSTKPIAKIKDKGICVIKAENNDANYVDTYKTTSITIYDGMAASFTQTINPLKQGDSALDPSTNTVIGKITGLAGNQGAVTYTLKVSNNSVDVSSDFTIDPNTGEITPASMIKYGTYDVEITLTDSTGSSGSIKVTGTIVVGLEENTNFKITYKGSPTVGVSESYTTAIKGMDVGTTGRKGSGQVHYRLSASSHKDPKENTEAIIVNDDGTITVNRATTSDDVYEVYAYVEQDLIGGYAKQETSAIPIIITDASMPNMSWLVDGVSATEIHTDYGPDKKIQLGVDQAPAGSTIEYVLVEDGTGKNNGIDVSDVVKVDKATGKVTILHANLTTQVGNVLIKAIVFCPGYTDTELTPLPILIDKAEQANFRFAQGTYTVLNGSGKFSPILLNGVPHDDGITYNNKLDCPDGYGDVTVDPDDPTGFIYNVTDVNGGTFTLKAKNLGNRDYKAKEVSATLRVMRAGEALFDVNTDPSSKVISYGDAITIIPVDPESASISYEYESQDSTILKQDDADKTIFHGTKAGDASVKVIRKETGKQDAEVYVMIRVNPKEVQVELDGPCPYELLTGESIPSFSVKPFLDGDIINGDIIPDPDISVDVQTTTSGTYPIIITYPSNLITSNYKFIQVPCDLIITQDHSEVSWYQGFLPSDDKQNKIDLTKWYNQPVAIKSVHPEYDEISKVGNNDWDTSFTISQEGEHTIPFYFRKSSTNALSDSLKETIKIDYTSPMISNITAQNANTSTFARLLNAITFDQFYRQGVEVSIDAVDLVPADGVQISGVKEVTYEVNTLKDGEVDQNIKMATASTDEVTITLSNSGEYRVCATATDLAGNEGKQNCKDINVKKIDVDVNGDGKPDFNDPDGDGCPDFNIIYEENGIQKVMNEDVNRDGIPERNIDSDGDGKPDINVDTDEDGKPDVNLLIMTKDSWKPTKCVTQHGEEYASGIDLTPEVNIDLTSDLIPDINIDNIGDFKPHLNITKDDSAKPTLNLIDLHEWNPNHDYKKESFHYDSIGTDKKAQINVDTDGDDKPDVNIDFDGDKVPDINIDTDGDNIPDLNIDSNGDGKPDVNIDTNDDGIADENITKVTEWKPEKNGEKDGLPFDTMEIKGKSELEDNGIIVEKPDGTFLPNYAIKVDDVTESRKEEIKKNTTNLIDEAQEVKNVYDVKLLEDGVEVQPDGTIKVRIPIPEGIKNPALIVKKSDGTYEQVKTTMENGYLVYETNELGTVSVIGDKENVSTPDPTPTPEPKDPVEKPSNSKPPVQGNYVTSQTNKGSIGANMGGVSTGDSTSLSFLLFSTSSMGILLIYLIILKKRNKHIKNR